MKITVFDTPGLADGTGNDESYLNQIREKVASVDLFLFCTDMTSKRFGDDDARTIEKLTRTFGTILWDHALVVLTFANEVHAPSRKDVTEKEFFQQKIQRFQKKIQELLRRQEVPEEAVYNLPFVPAGELTKPRLPGRDNWLTAFWIVAFKRINRNAKAAFLMANLDRITRTIQGGDRMPNEEDIDVEIFWTQGSLRRSSPVISTSEGKDYRELLKRIKSKQLTLTTEDGNDNDTLCGYDDGNETRRGSLRRNSASVSADARDRFPRRMQRRKSSQGLKDGNDSRYKCVDIHDVEDGDDDDVLRRCGRISLAARETEKHVYNPHECGTLYSLPPAYDEVVRNPVPLPMDDSSYQELFQEMVREVTTSKQTGEYVGVSVRRSRFGRMYSELFKSITEFIRRFLRGKKTTKAVEVQEKMNYDDADN